MEVAFRVIGVLLLEFETLVLLMGVWSLEELQQEVEHGCSFDFVDNDLSFSQHLETITSSGLVKSSRDCIMPLLVELMLADPYLLHSWFFGMVELEFQP